MNELRLAGAAVNKAKKAGELVPEPCFICGDPVVQAHHSSYAEDMRLAVTWLCVKHHRIIHDEARAERYVRLPGESLSLGIGTVKAHLSAVLDYIVAVGVVTITKRGRPHVIMVRHPDYPTANRPGIDGTAQSRPAGETSAAPVHSETPKPPAARNRAGRPGLTLAQLTAASRP